MDRHNRSRRLRRRLLGAVLLGSLGVLGCKSETREPVAGAAPAPAKEPLRLTFTLPAHFAPVELRGEGSEALRAPPGARVQPIEGGVRVEAAADFAIDVRERAPSFNELSAKVPPQRRVLEESDLVVFEAPGGHAFVSARELVPEWDESDRRRFSCSSAGAAAPGADARGFPLSALQDMVAACRTLELPSLE